MLLPPVILSNVQYLSLLYACYVPERIDWRISVLLGYEKRTAARIETRIFSGGGNRV